MKVMVQDLAALTATAKANAKTDTDREFVRHLARQGEFLLANHAVDARFEWTDRERALVGASFSKEVAA